MSNNEDFQQKLNAVVNVEENTQNNNLMRSDSDSKCAHLKYKCNVIEKDTRPIGKNDTSQINHARKQTNEL